MDKKINAIYCPNCGAPARFDILTQRYLCGYCGSEVGIDEAIEQKQGFRKIQSEKLQNSVKDFKLFYTTCDGCGARIVFEENEALSTCPFCGKSLVRNEYIRTRNMPECVIPFRITETEAKDKLIKWCQENRLKTEAKELLKEIEELKGFYLPYELVRGPVHLQVSRMDGDRTYYGEGFLDDEFINRSRQLDNLLLDGMEPYDTDDLTEFSFGYVAGHRVKIADINDKALEDRVDKESAENYTPAMRKVLETDAVEVDADASDAIRLPVLLPVYYVCKGELMAAVNGQTGKVSVRALKDSHYYFLPWWLKAIVATIGFSALICAILYLFSKDLMTSLYISGILALFFIIVTLCLYSDTTRNRFAVSSGRKIFTSDDRKTDRKIIDPIFFEKIDGRYQPVILKFTTPLRVLKIALLCFVVLFLPVIIALFVNGFDFKRLQLGGSAVWFCIFVPVVPIYLLKFGIVELHDNPWIYIYDQNNRIHRYRQKIKLSTSKHTIKDILAALFVPPLSLAVWFGIISFIVMVYLTAFGF
ncbi:MAG: hypothetical protein IKS69_04735 [Erysipelotrichaceae bacterium]|nr:hypothetical protein [Erysipelotrichaceae bacterium]